MIVAIGSQKGGVGKSTTSVNICAELAQQGKDIILVDTDHQASSTFWATERAEEHPDLPKVHCIQKYDNIRDTVIDLNERYDIVLIDCAGRDSLELRSAIITANILIIPLRTAIFDLETLRKMQEIINQSKLINPDLKVHAVLTMCSTNPVVGEKNDSIEYLEDYPDIKLTTTVIGDRKVYRDSTNMGMGVTEITDNTSTSARKARQEIKSLIREVL